MDYNYFNNLKGVVWSNYSAWLNRMADTRWHETTKLLIKEAVQNKLNTMHNKKPVSMESTQEVHNIAVLKLIT